MMAKTDNLGVDLSDYNFWSKATLVPLAMMQNLQSLIWPADLRIFYAYPSVKHGWLDWTDYLAWLLALTIIVLVIKARRQKLVIFGSLLFAMIISVHLPWLNVNQSLTADRYLYLASLGWCLVVVVVLEKLAKLIRPNLLTTLLVAYFFTLALMTYVTCLNWSDNVRLLETAAWRAPHSGLLQYHLAQAYYSAGMNLEALTQARLAIQLDTNNAYAYALEANILAFDLKQTQAGLRAFERCLQFFPSFALCYQGRGQARWLTQDQKGACHDWQRAAELGLTESRQWLERYCHPS